MATGKVSVQLPGQACISLLAFGPGGRSVTSLREDSTLTVWDVVTHRSVRRTRLETWGRSQATAISPDGKVVVAATSDYSIIVWDAASGKQTGKIQLGAWNSARRIALSPDGRTVAAASGEGAVLQLWDVATSKEVNPRPTNRGGAGSPTFSRDGRMLATTDGNSFIRLWETSTGTEVRRIADGPNGIWSVPMEEDDRLLLVTEVGPTGYIAFSLDAKEILSCGRDGALRFWRVDSGRLARSVSLRASGPVGLVAFSPDRALIAATGKDSDSLGLWESHTGRLIARTSTGHEGATTARRSRPTARPSLQGGPIDLSGFGTARAYVPSIVSWEPGIPCSASAVPEQCEDLRWRT